MIARSGQRRCGDEEEPLRPSDCGVGVERLGGYELFHLRVPRGRLEILAHGQEIDAGGAHVVHYLVHLEALLAEADHHTRLREDVRRAALHALQKAERGIVARARADRRIEPRHGLEIVIIDVGARLDDRIDGRFALVAKVGRQDLDRRLRRVAAERLDHLHELRSTTVRQVVAIDRRHYDMLQPQFGRSNRDMLGLQRVDRARHARLHIAEGAGPCARVAQDHHRCVFLGPALPDVRTSRFLADGGEVELAHQSPRRMIAFADGRLDPDPVRLALLRAVLRQERSCGADSDWPQSLPPLPFSR